MFIAKFIATLCVEGFLIVVLFDDGSIIVILAGSDT